jgi:hypothetical protein
MIFKNIVFLNVPSFVLFDECHIVARIPSLLEGPISGAIFVSFEYRMLVYSYRF